MRAAFNFQCTKCGQKKEPSAFQKGHRRCKECSKAYLAKWYANNRERVSEESKLSRARNPEINQERCRDYYARNAERVIECVKQNYQQNRERIMARMRSWYARTLDQRREYDRIRRKANPEKMAALNRLYRINNPEVRKVHHQRRRAKKKGAEGWHTVADWRALVKRFEGLCVCCKKHFGLKGLTQDHVVPLVKGGSNYIENIQPLCMSCNSRKGQKSTDYR